ncbi:MFS transporter [Serratia entomophila]|jgi:sugar phosphate permease|uniref:MFS transporter n=1 Tax=Serratia entomophila TaxID=42906 RepID=A0ABY5CU94_9GAMM|nr:MFS transporter [Serratia entomophila]USV01013.1 MFS transporter [Serratia entomophila]CAI0923280.1 D-galactarate permease [Serratia entomophila]CAI1034268.1 D-galactarate permease [Serratia entomophila]CAI1050534.1 D-galactarate permease [Serratia entomophila]CAI1054696.1 D-galactarate permease [Serratia entomophila]
MTHALTDSRYRYRIFAMVFLIALINYVDRGALSFAANDISHEFNFDKAQLGAVLGYFGFGYLFGSLCGGFLADRIGTKKVWLLAGALWSLLEIATAWAGELGVALFGGSAILGFAALRIMFGFAEGPAYALMNKTIAHWAPRKERGFALGIGLLSTQVGALLTAPLAVGLLLLTGDWRSMFMLLGLFSLLAILLFARGFTDTPQQHPRVNAAELAAIEAGQQPEGPQPRLPWWAFFTNRTLVFNALGYFSFLYVTFVLVTWGPKYLQDTFNYDLRSLWYVAMIPWSGACFTVLLGGRLADALLRRFGNLRLARNLFATVTLLLTAICFLLIPFMRSPAEIILLMTLGNALNALVNNVYWSVVIDVTPKASVGAYSGMTLAIANVAAITAPMLSGWLAQHHGYGAMFFATAAVSFCSMLCMTLLQPEKKIAMPPTAPGTSKLQRTSY